MKKVWFGHEQPYGFYAYEEYGVLVIGENWPREGGDIYCGDYKGVATPYLAELKTSAPKIYNKIVRYYERDEHSKETIEYMTDIERLKKVFEDTDPRSISADLYYALLAVVDEEKHDVALDHFKHSSLSRKYLVKEAEKPSRDLLSYSTNARFPGKEIKAWIKYHVENETVHTEEARKLVNYLTISDTALYTIGRGMDPVNEDLIRVCRVK